MREISLSERVEVADLSGRHPKPKELRYPFVKVTTGYGWGTHSERSWSWNKTWLVKKGLGYEWITPQ